MKIVVLNGPNLNMLEDRPEQIYGGRSLVAIQEEIEGAYSNHEFRFIQSNHEGELVEALQQAHQEEWDGIVANFAAYTHTSVAIRDAIEMIDLPVVEVHLSNIHSREAFREHSMTGAVAVGVITGFGAQSYLLGIQALEKHLKDSNLRID